MEKEIELKKKNKKKTKGIFADKKKRYFVLIALVLPLLIAVGVFGFVAFREAKNLLALAKGEDATIKDEFIVETMNYRLRDKATDYQKEIFSQLKETLESEEYDDLAAVELVAKNYIADFYTFSNKAGQYDIGGMYYWYSGKDEKKNAYLAARDGFYKYMSYYKTEYGSENLIEVDDVQINKCVKESDVITLSEHYKYEQGEDGDWYDVRIDNPYDTYNVSVTWTYKEGYMPSSTKFPTTLNMIILKRDKFEIIYTSEKTINVKSIKNETQTSDKENEVESGTN